MIVLTEDEHQNSIRVSEMYFYLGLSEKARLIRQFVNEKNVIQLAIRKEKNVKRNKRKAEKLIKEAGHVFNY